MVPDRIPLTPNGKLDRLSVFPPGREDHRLLPDPVDAPPHMARTEREERLCCLMADALGVPEVAPEANFFALGGNSLRATRLIGRIRNEMGVEIPMRAVFEYATVAELAARWDDIASAARPRLRRMAKETES
ncbi:phosphopantetheine-binding protein [Streptomyces sp. NPDC051217]|uniref:phosphopantetheine-binding protein n=1 Tax=Streptomyces sp. NPDC051217 TaxID=3365644 RepID=UPI0037BBC55A